VSLIRDGELTVIIVSAIIAREECSGWSVACLDTFFNWPPTPQVRDICIKENELVHYLVCRHTSREKVMRRVRTVSHMVLLLSASQVKRHLRFYMVVGKASRIEFPDVTIESLGAIDQMAILSHEVAYVVQAAPAPIQIDR
jgi:hypothetical protein